MSRSSLSPDGSRLLFISHAGRECASLRSFEITTGVASQIYEENWDIVGAAYSKSGRYLTVDVFSRWSIHG